MQICFSLLHCQEMYKINVSVSLKCYYTSRGILQPFIYLFIKYTQIITSYILRTLTFLLCCHFTSAFDEAKVQLQRCKLAVQIFAPRRSVLAYWQNIQSLLSYQ